MRKTFKTNFDSFVCDGDEITATRAGFTFRAIVERDDTNETPWERDEGHGPVSDWTSRAKRPGERVLAIDDRGSLKRFYDFQEAVKIARRDGWDCAPYARGVPGDISTRGWIANRAAEHDFKVLKGWCNDEWYYVGVCVEVSRNDEVITEKYSNALWGIECNYPAGPGEMANSYLAEVANELADEALDKARLVLAKERKAKAEAKLDCAIKALSVARAQLVKLRNSARDATKAGR